MRISHAHAPTTPETTAFQPAAHHARESPEGTHQSLASCRPRGSCAGVGAQRLGRRRVSSRGSSSRPSGLAGRARTRQQWTTTTRSSRTRVVLRHLSEVLMPQFDVYRTRSSTTYPLVVDVQADVHARLGSRVVVPMVLRTRYAQTVTRLTSQVTIRDDEYVVLMPQLSAIPRTELGLLVGSLAPQQAPLIAALDLLVTGS